MRTIKNRVSVAASNGKKNFSMIDKKVCLLVNPYAAFGQPVRILEKIEATLRRLNIHFYTLLTNDIPEAQKLAREAADNDEYIFVLGGDGTLRVIAEVLKYTQAVVTIIPCGRGNDFARVLNIPLDPIAACEVLANGIVKVIDMAEVNQKPYLSICSLGFDSIANEIANRTKFIPGSAIYVYAGLLALIHWKPAKFYVKIDGMSFEHIGYTVAVANSTCYGGGMQLAPQASMTDGYLDVVLVGDISKFRMLVNFPRVFRGTHIHEAGFSMKRAKQVHIETDAKYTVYADGDAISSPPADIRVLPNALRVLVPN